MNKKSLYALTTSFLFLSNTLFSVQSKEILPDHQSGVTVNGGFVRKGTIYASMLNAQAFEELKTLTPGEERKQKYQQIRQDVEELVPSLHNIGLFSFFTPEEWVCAPLEREGRIFIALLYLQQHASELNGKILAHLTQIQPHASLELQKEINMTLSASGT